jgi:hypothetical protein
MCLKNRGQKVKVTRMSLRIESNVKHIRSRSNPVRAHATYKAALGRTPNLARYNECLSHEFEAR